MPYCKEQFTADRSLNLMSLNNLKKLEMHWGKINDPSNGFK